MGTSPEALKKMPPLLRTNLRRFQATSVLVAHQGEWMTAQQIIAEMDDRTVADATTSLALSNLLRRMVGHRFERAGSYWAVAMASRKDSHDLTKFRVVPA